MSNPCQRMRGNARKGEHVKIDGEIVMLDDPPPLDLRKKHTIEVVVDRFKAREDIQLRLAESFETTLKLRDGLAQVDFMDKTRRKPLSFSSKFSCPECTYSLSELEPRLFSFNNPVGACSVCDGLGVKPFFDQAKVVINPSASLADGAIRGWGSHYQFDLNTPFEALSEEIREVILYGSGTTTIHFVNSTEKGTTFARQKPFEGIIPNI